MMRIAVLFNDRLAIPALQQLVQGRMIVAAGTSDRSPEMIALMKQLSAQGGVPSTIFTKKGLEANLSEWIETHRPDVVLVKTFPYKIPASVLTLPKQGFINFHYAPLPGFRGSNPLFWMIKEQVAMGGVAIHRMDENFDTGPLLFQKQVPISSGDTFGMCSTKLAYAGVELTGALLQALQTGNLNPVPQQNNQSRWYGRPSASDMTINWNAMNALQVMALVNACNPWLKGAVTRGNGWTFGITKASVAKVTVPENTAPGTILELDDDRLIIACSEGTAIRIDVLYCEEGFYPGQQLAAFGFRKGQKLGA